MVKTEGEKEEREGKEGEELQAVAARPAPPCPDRWPHGFGLRCSPVEPRAPESAAVSAAGGAAQGERATAACPGSAQAARGQAAAPAGLGGAAVPAGPPPTSPPFVPGSGNTLRGPLRPGGRRGSGPAVTGRPGPGRLNRGAAGAQPGPRRPFRRFLAGPRPRPEPVPSTRTFGTHDPKTAMMGAGL